MTALSLESGRNARSQTAPTTSPPGLLLGNADNANAIFDVDLCSEGFRQLLKFFENPLGHFGRRRHRHSQAREWPSVILSEIHGVDAHFDQLSFVKAAL